MPVRERNTAEKNRPRGAAKREQEFVEATEVPPSAQASEPAPASPVAQPAFAPDQPIVPQAFAPQPDDERNLPPPDEVLVEGEPLTPEEMAVLSRPGQPQALDVEELADWAQVIFEIASRRGAHPGMVRLADALRRRLA